MPVTTILDGDLAAALMDPTWQIQRIYQLGWLEASMESSNPTLDGSTFVGFSFDLVVQLWFRRTLDALFEPVAETIVPAGEKRAITKATRVGYGFVDVVRIPAGSQIAVVHNGGLASWYADDPKPTLTVTPHGTWA